MVQKTFSTVEATGGGAGPTAPVQSRSRSLRPYYAILAQLVALAVLIAFFAIQNPLFFSIDNFQNIGRQSSVLMLVALGGTLVIMIGSIDLSVGAIATLSTLVTAIMIDSARPFLADTAGFDPGAVFSWIVALAAGTAVGALAGVANGTLLVYAKVPSFLATLGMLSVLSGISGHVSGGQSIIFQDWDFTDMVNGAIIFSLPTVSFVAILFAAVLSFVALRMRFGRYLYAIGGGEVVASNSGVPIARFKIYAFVVCGATCGLAGALLAGQVGAGSMTAGDALLLDSIAAIVMGGTALSGGVGGPHRTILGVLLIAVLSNGMDVTEVGGFTQDIVKGLVIIIAVALTTDRRKYQFIK